MTEYRMGRLDDEADILDFINLVFSQSHYPHHFDQLLPKVYAHPGFSAIHALAVADGRIRAAVAVMPMTMGVRCAGELKGGYVGSVSVHERDRGMGHMKALMEMHIHLARENGYDFLALGGQRQRYGYWGFEKHGGVVSFSFNGANVRHAMGAWDGEGISLDKVGAGDQEALDLFTRLNEARPLFCVRPRERALDILLSFEGTPYALRDSATGELLGGLVAHGNEITDLLLTDEARLPQAIKRWMKDRPDCKVDVPLCLPERIRTLKALAENYTLQDEGMIKILHWPRVLRAALMLKKSGHPLPDGRMIVEIEGEGRLALTVDKEEVSVLPTREAPDHILTQREAVEWFFAPLSALTRPDPRLAAWLPLPLTILRPDQF